MPHNLGKRIIHPPCPVPDEEKNIKRCTTDYNPSDHFKRAACFRMIDFLTSMRSPVPIKSIKTPAPMPVPIIARRLRNWTDRLIQTIYGGNSREPASSSSYWIVPIVPSNVRSPLSTSKWTMRSSSPRMCNTP